MRLYESHNFRVDQIAPTSSAEDTVVTGTFDLKVVLVAGWNSCTQLQGRLGLARAGDVIEFAFDSQQTATGDVLRAPDR